MNNNIESRLQQIKVENYIWIIYLIIIALSYYSNYLEKDYFLTNNMESKNKYRKINILIFTTLVLIYAYFEKDSLQSFFSKEKTDKQKKFDTLALIGSTAVLLSGILFLYIVLEDKEIEEEVAFN